MDSINYFNKFTHEIKNPLTVCNGYLDMMLKCDEKDIETYLKIVKEEIKRSLDIIKDYSNNKFLDINKNTFKLDGLFIDIKNNLSNLYKENDSEIVIISNNNLNDYVDYSKLKQVFINLIKNSYESKSNNKLIITIKIEDIKNNYKISIIDNGIGISKNNLKYIFNDYYTTKEEGNGLGISYAKEIIKLHNGSIKYYSEEKKGTTVEVILPK